MQDLAESTFEIAGPRGSTIRGDFRYRAGDSSERLPLVVVCHGFKAFKDWGPFPEIGRFFARAGIASIVFNFSHNGIGAEPRKFSEPERFAANTIGTELEDVRRILDAVEKGTIGKSVIDVRRIGLVGHSRGGGIAIVAGKEDPRVAGVAAWSSIARFGRYSEEQRRRWKERGFVPLPSINPLSVYRLDVAFLDDLEAHARRYDILDAAAKLAKPLLLIHGTADIPVPLAEARELAEAADKSLTQFVVLEGAGHMYGARHPYRKESPVMTHVLDVTTSWFHHLFPSI